MFVIGSENCVLGLALVGVEGSVVQDAQELQGALDAALGDASIAILLISRETASLARERVDQLKVASMTPLVVEVPGQGEAVSYPPLKEFVQRVVGVALGGD